MFSSLGSPDRNDRIEDTSTPPVDKTSEDHPGGVLSRALKRGTEDSPASTQRDGLYAAVFVTKPATNETADQGTDVIDRDLFSIRGLSKIVRFKRRTIPP